MFLLKAFIIFCIDSTGTVQIPLSGMTCLETYKREDGKPRINKSKYYSLTSAKTRVVEKFSAGRPDRLREHERLLSSSEGGSVALAGARPTEYVSKFYSEARGDGLAERRMRELVRTYGNWCRKLVIKGDFLLCYQRYIVYQTTQSIANLFNKKFGNDLSFAKLVAKLFCIVFLDSFCLPLVISNSWHLKKRTSAVSSLDSYSKDSYSSHFLADSTDSRVWGLEYESGTR